MTDRDPMKEDIDGEAPPPNKSRAEIDALDEDARRSIGETLAYEQALDMRQQREARRIALGFLVIVASASGVMMLSLWLAVYWGIGGYSLEVFLLHDAHWPLGIFISGTFISFITACGGLALGVFTSMRRKREQE